jgi:hypothetical protein
VAGGGGRTAGTRLQSDVALDGVTLAILVLSRWSERACFLVMVALVVPSCDVVPAEALAPPDAGANEVPALTDAGPEAGLASVDLGDSTPILVDSSSGVGRARLAVPAYFYPGPQWDRLIAAAPTVGMIIFNPASGPGQAADPQYTTAISEAKAAGIVVLAYVYTNYGQRPSADVLDDIKRTYDFYAPSGIYLAEGPMEADCGPLEAEYHAFADAARGRDPRAYLAVGTRFCPTYVYFFDLMVEFARNWTEYQTYTPPSWMPANSPERFCAFVDGVPSASASAALSRAVTNGAGWVFATDEGEPNPWGRLPSYFDDEVRAVATLVR